MRSIPISGLIAISAALLLAQTALAQTADDTPPSLIYRSEPEYSAEATRARVQSSVTLSITVGEDGRAHDIHVVEGAGFGLDEKAIEAMDKWRFNPGTHNGKPAPVPANIEMNFSILARNDPEDHSGQRARLNFTLPPNASRPELVAGKLPPNPGLPGEQSLKFHLQIDKDGVPKNVTVVSSNDPVWVKQVTRVVQIWRFRPAVVDGNPVQVEGIFEMAHSGGLETTGTAVLENANIGGEEPPPAPAAPQRTVVPLNVGGLNPRVHHTATRLPNGTILLAGGAAHNSELPPGSADFHPLASSQIFDWATRRIVNTGDLNAARSNHVAVLLRDGTVLIAGGRATEPIATAEIFDPSTGKFSRTGSMREAREMPAAAMLPDGRVLICGGMTAGNKYLASAEIYDPRTKTFAVTGSMTTTRAFFHAVILKDGRILLLGGFGPAGATAEVYDPARGTFRTAGSMAAPRYNFSATMLATGKILIAGGSLNSDTGPGSTIAELYDPDTNTFRTTGPMSQPRVFHEAAVLNDGKVLLSGGLPGSPGSPITRTEIYDPASGTFTQGPDLAGRHTGHTSTLLQDGTLLIAGSGLIGNGGIAELLLLN